MRIRELVDRTGITERQLRYLISEGFVPRPYGGRANAEYGAEHLEAVRRYLRLRELGFPPAAIRVLLEARQGVPIPIADGVTLVVDPRLIASGEPVAPLVERLQRVLRELLEDKADVVSSPTTRRSPGRSDRT